MLREYIIGEAMHALGIPTTRALAVVATGDRVARDTFLPGAVLTRVAASHIRVGHVRVRGATAGPGRSCGGWPTTRSRATTRGRASTSSSSKRSCEAQAALIAQWMLVGFIHGVMNTDNMAISGETIDYGPCAFMDAFDPATVFSSIDHGGRYAYGNQPHIAQWNLARLAEALLPLIDADDRSGGRRGHRRAGHLPGPLQRAVAPRHARQARPGEDRTEHASSSTTCSTLLRAQRVDYTSAFRALSAHVRGDASEARVLFTEPDAVRRSGRDALAPTRRARGRGRDGPRQPGLHPAQPPVEEALDAATAGDLEPFERLVDVARRARSTSAPGSRPTPSRRRRASARTARSAAPDGRPRERRGQPLHDARHRRCRRGAVGVAASGSRPTASATSSGSPTRTRGTRATSPCAPSWRS